MFSNGAATVAALLYPLGLLQNGSGVRIQRGIMDNCKRITACS
jgi:hypothetical protein